MTEPKIIVCRDSVELNQRAAEDFVHLAEQAVSAAGRFTAALSGGSTPKGLYSLLAAPGYKERIAWFKVHLFWGDERCVPPDHPESNYRMVQESLLSKISIPAENVHRMAGEKEPSLAAAEYEEQLRTFFHLPKAALPRFDFILLGLGEDGHTASLFPGSDALSDTERLVTAPYVDKLDSYRLTLTLPVLNHAAQIVFLVAGESKAAVVKEVLRAEPASSTFPAAKVKPPNSQLTWLITQDAASELRG